MQTLDVVRLAALIAAFATSASKLLPATMPFWANRSPVVSRWLPGIILVLGALPASLAGVTTWEQFALAVMGAAAFALPGTHKNLAAPLSEPARTTIKPPPLALLALGLVLLACGSGSPRPCSAEDPTVAAKLAECKARQLTECKDVPTAECPVRTECREWIRSYCQEAP